MPRVASSPASITTQFFYFSYASQLKTQSNPTQPHLLSRAKYYSTLLSSQLGPTWTWWWDGACLLTASVGLGFWNAKPAKREVRRNSFSVQTTKAYDLRTYQRQRERARRRGREGRLWVTRVTMFVDFELTGFSHGQSLQIWEGNFSATFSLKSSPSFDLYFLYLFLHIIVSPIFYFFFR